MLRPLPLEAVRKQHHEAAGAQPLRLPGGDELVDYALRAIGEVAELRFPKNQCLRVGERIAVFETEYAEFGQRAVAHFEARASDGGQRDIFLARLLIDPYGMPLAESASSAVLACKSDAEPVGEGAARCGPR